MALAHNVIIRGLNSVYKQVQHVRRHDCSDFVGYAYCWYQVLQGASFSHGYGSTTAFSIESWLCF